jgi:hypothetical protein
MSFDEVVRVIKLAAEVFPRVDTAMMLGYEPADRIEALAQETRVTINHYILDCDDSTTSYDLIHLTARNLDYYVDLFAFIERGVNAGGGRSAHSVKSGSASPD